MRHIFGPIVVCGVLGLIVGFGALIFDSKSSPKPIDLGSAGNLWSSTIVGDPTVGNGTGLTTSATCSPGFVSNGLSCFPEPAIRGDGLTLGDVFAGKQNHTFVAPLPLGTVTSQGTIRRSDCNANGEGCRYFADGKEMLPTDKPSHEGNGWTPIASDLIIPKAGTDPNGLATAIKTDTDGHVICSTSK